MEINFSKVIDILMEAAVFSLGFYTVFKLLFKAEFLILSKLQRYGLLLVNFCLYLLAKYIIDQLKNKKKK